MHYSTVAFLSKHSDAFRLEMCMGMGFPVGMGIPWDSHRNGNDFRGSGNVGKFSMPWTHCCTHQLGTPTGQWKRSPLSPVYSDTTQRNWTSSWVEMCRYKWGFSFCHNCIKYWLIFRISFTHTLCRKFAIKWPLKIPPPPYMSLHYLVKYSPLQSTDSKKPTISRLV